MSSKRDFECALFDLWESATIDLGSDRADALSYSVRAYVVELERCLRESSELKADTIRLAEQRAWEAAREQRPTVQKFGSPDWGSIGSVDRYETFSDWKRHETARELTQEAEELGMRDEEREGK